MNGRLDIVELDGRPVAAGGPVGGPAHNATVGMPKRPWLSVHWKCCHTYSRIYRNRAGTAYEGCCPKCGTRASATIGPGGTNARFFTAE